MFIFLFIGHMEVIISIGTRHLSPPYDITCFLISKSNASEDTGFQSRGPSEAFVPELLCHSIQGFNQEDIMGISHLSQPIIEPLRPALAAKTCSIHCRADSFPPPSTPTNMTWNMRGKGILIRLIHCLCCS